MMMKVLSVKGPEGLAQLSTAKAFDFSKSEFTRQQQKGILFSDRRKEIEKKYRTIRAYGPELIATLAPEDVSEVSASQVKWLATLAQVNNLLDERVDDLLAAQVSNGLYPLHKVHLLKKLELIQAIKDAQGLLKLHETQLVHITKKQRQILVEALTAKKRLSGLPSIEDKHLQYLQLTEEQIESLAWNRVIKIHIDQWPLISNQKLQEIQKEKPDAIGESEAQKMKPSQLKILNGSYGKHLTDGQIKEFTEEHAQLIQAIETDGKLTLLSDQALQKIKISQLNFIGKENFQRITKVDLLLGTPERCVGFLNDQQKEQIAQAIETLTEDAQLSLLNDLALQKIKPSKLGFIGKENFQRITQLELLLAAPQRCIDFLSEAQKDRLQAALLREENLKECGQPIFHWAVQINPIIIQKIKKPEQVAWLNNEEELRILEDDQLIELSDAQVTQHVRSNSLVSRLKTHAPHKYKLLLSNEVFKSLTEAHDYLIQEIQTDEQLSLLKNKALQKIHPKQLSFIGKDNFQRIIDTDLLCAIPKRCIDFLSARQRISLFVSVPKLSTMEKISEPVFHLVVQEYHLIVKKLTEPQVKWINRGIDLYQLEDHQLGWLSDQQVKQFAGSQTLMERLKKHAPGKFVVLFSDDHIASLEEEDTYLIQALTSDKQLSLLNDKALQQIHPSQLNFIEKDNFQRLTRLEILLAIPQRCLDFVSVHQKAAIITALKQKVILKKTSEVVFRLVVKELPEIIKKLSESKVTKWLTTEDEFSQLADHQLAWLSDAQVQDIHSPALIKRLEMHAPNKVKSPQKPVAAPIQPPPKVTATQPPPKVTAPIQPPSGVTATPQPAPTVVVPTQPPPGVTGTKPPPRVTVPIQPPSGVAATPQPAPTVTVSTQPSPG